jgi:hypothetical protein
MADQLVKLPIGVVEDMLIQIGKYFISIDFVIVDMEEDAQTPLLLGRPFLNMAKAIIDVHEGMIFFKIGDDKITFQVDRAMKYPSNEKSIFRIDVVDTLVQKELQKAANERPLEKLLGDRDLTAQEEQNELIPISSRATEIVVGRKAQFKCMLRKLFCKRIAGRKDFPLGRKLFSRPLQRKSCGP